MIINIIWLLIGAALICAGAFLMWGLGAALVAAGLKVFFALWVVVN